MRADTAVPTYYLHLIAEELDAAGIDAPRWLAERTTLTPEQLGDPAASLSFSQMRGLLRDAAAAVGPDLGLRVGARMGLQHHGVLGYAAMSSPSLRHTAELFQRFCPLRAPLLPSFTRVEGGEFRFVFEDNPALGDIGPLMLEAAVLGMKKVFDLVAAGAATGEAEGPVAYVAFAADAPGDRARYSSAFGCPVRFGEGWTGLALPLSKLDLPLAAGDPAAYREAMAMCEREMASVARQASWSGRVGRLLQEAPEGIPALSLVARRLHVSPRTLHRRLLAEGTSYKALLDAALRRKAVEKLRAPESSIQEVAFALGYTDVANFRRAFKRWEGVAPSAYRAALARN